jgi:hypothetical protein
MRGHKRRRVGVRDETRVSQAGFVPIVSPYAARIGLVDEIDRLMHCEMEVSPGPVVVLAMIFDALTGRTLLFRLSTFFADKDVGMLLWEKTSL